MRVEIGSVREELVPGGFADSGPRILGRGFWAADRALLSPREVCYAEKLGDNADRHWERCAGMN